MTRLSLLLCCAVAADARADVLNHDRLRAHVDETFARGEHLTPARRLPLVAGTLIPVYGTWKIENKVFGGLRPSGVIFDWFLGGIAPLGLGIGALVTDGTTRKALGWTALGLYGGTRLAILVIANLHISAYNRAVRVQLDAIPRPSGAPTPALSFRVEL